MNPPPPLAAAPDIDKIAKNLLMASKAWGKFPTPVDQVVQYAELQIERGVDLSKIDPGFLTKNFHFLSRTLSKVVGLVDFRQKKIYLDLSQKPTRLNFVKLHEVGHDACSWQKESKGFMDDDETLDPEIDEIFEREASYFASNALFQMEIFDDEVLKLPLGMGSAKHLAGRFGGSNHAAIRRYVERSPKRCALLVLHKPVENGEYSAKIRNYFQSEAFTKEFGQIEWPSGECGLDYIFVQEIQRNRQFHEKGQIALTTGSGELVTFKYHFFKTPYNTFILLLPEGEEIKSRTIIVPK